MELRHILQNFAIGELAGSPWVSLDTFEIEGKRIPFVINALNNAILHIYSILPLKVETAPISIMDGVSKYKLSENNTLSNIDSPEPKYIMLSSLNCRPLQIISVESSTGELIELDGETGGVYLDGAIGLVVTNPRLSYGNVLSVTYLAAPPDIPLTENKYSEFDVDIPHVVVPAVMAKAASIAYRGMGENHINLAEYWTGVANALIDSLKIQSIGQEAISTNNHNFRIGGWI